MRNAPRIFPSRLERGARRVYLAVTLFYLLLFLALVWPVYPRFAGITPRVLGLPFSLAYVVAGVLLSFVVLWALFTWENRRTGGPDSIDEGTRPRTTGGDAPARVDGAAD